MYSVLRNTGSGLKKLMMFLIIFAHFFTSYAQAGLVSTSALMKSKTESYTQDKLQAALASESVKSQLEAMGVDVGHLDQRVASLTPEEVQQLNENLADQPAGGIINALVAVFVVFVITDMLCATDIFSFVNCINR